MAIKSSTRAIIGGVLGGVAALALVAWIICLKSRQQNAAQRSQQDAEARIVPAAGQMTDVPKGAGDDGIKYPNSKPMNPDKLTVESLVPTPRSFPPPRLLVHGPDNDRYKDHAARRSCTAPAVPAKDTRRYSSLDSRSMAKGPVPAGHAAFETDAVARSLSKKASRRHSHFGDISRKSPRLDRASPQSGNFLTSPRSFERPLSVVSFTSTLYSSDASIHDAETQSVMQPERPRLTNRLSDSAVLMRVSRPYSSPVRISI